MADTLVTMTGGDPDIDFKARAVRANDVSSHEALASMVGYGFSMVVDPKTGKSHLYTDVGHFRDGFETLEMRYHKMLVSGEELVVNNGAVVSGVMAVEQEDLVTASGTADEPIESEPIVTQEGELIEWPLPKGVNRLRFTVKGETGIDYQMFITGDILRYTWRDKSTGLKGASGYLVVRAVVDEFTYTADVMEGSPEWLAEGMTLALFGSLTDPDRQGFIVLSSRERTISIFDGVNSTQITPDNLKVLLGNLSLVVDPTFPEIKGFGLYSQNAFLKGVFVLRSGNTVESELGKITDNTTKEFERVETEFSIIDGKIESKVSKIDYDILGKRVTDAESSISQTAEKIESKVSKTIKDKNGNDLNVETSVIQTAEQLSVNGLLNVNGQIRADKIDTDKLVARSLDTRVVGQGVYIKRGESSLEIYNRDGKKIATIDDGSTGLPRLELTNISGAREVVLDNEKLIKYSGTERTEYGNRIEGWRRVSGGLALLFKFGAYGITLPNTATVDMPGVLCAGRVRSGGNIDNQWGCKTCGGSRHNGQVGRYKMTHNIGHLDYYVTANIASDGFMGSVIVLEKTTTYVVLGVGGLDAGYYDQSFEFMICGKN